MKKNLRKVLSLCLALVMVLALLPVTAFAAEENRSYITLEDSDVEITTLELTDTYAMLVAHNTLHPEWTNADWRFVSGNPDVLYASDAHDPDDWYQGSAPGALCALKPGTVIVYAYAPESNYPTKLTVTIPETTTPAEHFLSMSAFSLADSYEKPLKEGEALTVKQHNPVFLAPRDSAVPETIAGVPDGYWTWTSSDENVIAGAASNTLMGTRFDALNPGTTVLTATDPEGRSVSVTVNVEAAGKPGQAIFVCRYDEENDVCSYSNRQQNYNNDISADPTAVFTVGQELWFGAFNWNEQYDTSMRDLGWYTWHTSDPSIMSVEGEEFVCGGNGNASTKRAVTKFVCNAPGIVEVWAEDTYPNKPVKVALIVVEPGHEHVAAEQLHHTIYDEPGWEGALGDNTFRCTCGFYWNTYIPANATEEEYHHMYEETERKEPTATEDGYILYTCTGTNCTATKTEVLPATGTECPSKNFVDVPGESNWAHAGIDYVVSKGLMNGIDATHFAPADDVTRAMLVTILWANEGKPTVTTDKTFSDVPANKWYAGAVAWAAENGIVSGRSATTFAPDDAVTRQDLALILKKYAEFKGISGAAAGSLDAFADKGSVSKYAQNAVAWAVANGIISGSNEGGKLYLNPADSATRGQTAAILMKFFENVK